MNFFTKTAGVLIATLGIIACFTDTTVSSVAIVVGSLGWVFGGFTSVIFFEDREALRRRTGMADDLAKMGYCPNGYAGEFEAAKFMTRCKGAGYDKCRNCIQYLMGDKPTQRIMSIQEFDELNGKTHDQNLDEAIPEAGGASIEEEE